jgi:intracellular septation protein
MEAKGTDKTKLISDYVPLIAFFASYFAFGLYPATAVLVVFTLGAVGLLYWRERRLPWLPIITALVVALFGGLTLLSGDERFIKMKPTVVQVIFAALLLGGLAFGKPLLKPLMGQAWAMEDVGWRKLSLRFALFFLVMAAANEVVWRTQSTDFWVTFKVFGLIGLTFLFTALQVPLMLRYKLPEGEEAQADADAGKTGDEPSSRK